MSYKISFLVISEILGLFGNTLTTDHMNFPHNRESSCKRFKGHFQKNQKYFLNCFLHLQNLHKILVILKKKISSIAQMSLKLLTLIYMVTWTPQSSRFRTPLRNRSVHRSETLKTSPWWEFYPNFALILGKINLENIALSQIWDLRTAW